jgi:hypothetical protein
MRAQRSNWLHQFLPRRRVVFAAGAIVAVSVALLAVEFAHNRTIFGNDLGGDFSSLYVAGKILARHGPDRLYDLDLQSRLYHELIPGNPPNVSLPYGYPPAVAAALRPLTALPYVWAVGIWTLVSGLLYLAGVGFLWLACRDIPPRDRFPAAMLCVAFEPFVIECLHGGQLSTVAFAATCAAIFCLRRGKLFAAGAAMGLLAYKPTLLLFLPLVLGRDRKILAGAGATILAGAGLSLWTAGIQGCTAFFRLMIAYARSTAGNGGFSRWKYVDLSAFSKLLLRQPDAPTWIVPAMGAAAIMVFLWRLSRRSSDRSFDLSIWAMALTATLVLNLYVGIYDSVLIVPALWLAAEEVYRRMGAMTSTFQWLLLAVFISPWISQFLAGSIGLQIDTLALLAVGGYQLSLWGYPSRTRAPVLLPEMV